MTPTTITPVPNVLRNPVEQFIHKHLAASAGRSPDDIKAKILHWIEVANHPERDTELGCSAYELQAKRRTARQNVRRLVARHPHIADLITRESRDREGAQ